MRNEDSRFLVFSCFSLYFVPFSLSILPVWLPQDGLVNEPVCPNLDQPCEHE
jgi:hypothetical protein